MQTTMPKLYAPTQTIALPEEGVKTLMRFLCYVMPFIFAWVIVLLAAQEFNDQAYEKATHVNEERQIIEYTGIHGYRSVFKELPK